MARPKLFGAGGGWWAVGAAELADLPFRHDLASELPHDPEKEEAAGEGQPDDAEQSAGEDGEDDAQRGGRGDTDEDGAPPVGLGQPGRCHADDDGVVAGKHQVDDDHGQKCGELCFHASLSAPR